MPPSQTPALCPNCSQPLRPEAKFCRACGYQIQAAGAALVSTPAPAADSPSAMTEKAQLVPSAPLSTPPTPAPATTAPALEEEIPRPVSEIAPPHEEQAAQAGTSKSKGKNRTLTLGLGCAALALVCILAVVLAFALEPSRNAILGLIYSPTPTATPTKTPDYQATNAQATSIASTATAAALFATQTAQASATYSARTATAAFEQTQAAATAAALQTQAEATQQAFQATQTATAQLDQAVVNICNGQGEPGAASYVAKRAFHPLIIYPDNYPYPDEARPQELSQLELVACVEESQATIRSSPYEKGHTCLEKVNLAKITIRNAKTGKAIRTNEVRGASPERCASVETFLTGEMIKTKTGGPIDAVQVWQKVKDLVYLELKSAFVNQEAVFAFQPIHLP
jgi:hypothetical protein